MMNEECPSFCKHVYRYLLEFVPKKRLFLEEVVSFIPGASRIDGISFTCRACSRAPNGLVTQQ